MPTKQASAPKFKPVAAPKVRATGPVKGFEAGNVRVENMTDREVSFDMLTEDGETYRLTLAPMDQRRKPELYAIPCSQMLSASSVEALRTHHGFASAETRNDIRVG